MRDGETGSDGGPGGGCHAVVARVLDHRGGVSPIRGEERW
jgi:hypothetical protein